MCCLHSRPPTITFALLDLLGAFGLVPDDTPIGVEMDDIKVPPVELNVRRSQLRVKRVVRLWLKEPPTLSARLPQGRFGFRNQDAIPT